MIDCVTALKGLEMKGSCHFTWYRGPKYLSATQFAILVAVALWVPMKRESSQNVISVESIPIEKSPVTIWVIIVGSQFCFNSPLVGTTATTSNKGRMAARVKLPYYSDLAQRIRVGVYVGFWRPIADRGARLVNVEGKTRQHIQLSFKSYFKTKNLNEACDCLQKKKRLLLMTDKTNKVKAQICVQ